MTVALLVREVSAGRWECIEGKNTTYDDGLLAALGAARAAAATTTGTTTAPTGSTTAPPTGSTPTAAAGSTAYPSKSLVNA